MLRHRSSCMWPACLYNISCKWIKNMKNIDTYRYYFSNIVHNIRDGHQQTKDQHKKEGQQKHGPNGGSKA